MTHLGLGPERGTLTALGELPRTSWSAERVAAPRHTSQLVRLIQNARRRGIPLGVVGRDGTHPGGVMAVDLSSWQHVGPPDRERLTVTVEPGASFRQILARTLPFGLVPKALPLDLDASLGGVLSGAAVGGASHRHGFLASQVAYAQVVLGTGGVVHTGPVTQRDAFDCVLGGAGRFGVITSVELKLEPAPVEVACYQLDYADCRGLVRDMLRLGNEPRVLHLLAGRSSQWERSGCQLPYRLDVALAASASGAPDLPRGLAPAGSQGPLLQGLDRLFESLHAQAVPGAFSGTRWGALLPDTPALPLVLEHVLVSMEASHVCSVTLLRRGADDPTALATPSTERVLVVSGRARPNHTGEASADDADVLAEMQRRVYRVGGRLCPSGWLPRRDPAFWRTHYGASYSRMSLLERLFDPARILSSSAGPLRVAP